MRIRNPKLPSAPLHVLVIAAGHRRIKAQLSQAGDQVLPLDRTDVGHLGDFADLEAVAVDIWNRGVISNA